MKYSGITVLSKGATPHFEKTRNKKRKQVILKNEDIENWLDNGLSEKINSTSDAQGKEVWESVSILLSLHF
ncbi:hypothetical protein KCTC52924_01950 [Arenibacter antarcticus]|nr:hypothetical protein [Arenibacter sp. H213]